MKRALGDSTHEHAADLSPDNRRKAVLEKYNPLSPLADVSGLLSTGLLEGFPVTYRYNRIFLNGFVQGLGYRCGCSSCNYTKVLSAFKFEEHAKVSTHNQNDHIFFDSGISIHKLVNKLAGRNLGSLNEMIQEEIHSPPNVEQFEKWKASFITNKRDTVITTNVDNTWNVDPKSDELHQERSHKISSNFSIKEKGSPVVKDIDHIIPDSVDDLPPCAALINTFKSPLSLPSEKQGVESAGDLASDNAKRNDHEMIRFSVHLEEKGRSYEKPNMNQRTNVLKYTPSSYTSDVKSLLSTGILEGVPVKYVNDEEKLHGIIGGTGYRCGCSSCEYSKVVSALEFEKHAGATSKNQNNNIYFESGITIYMLAKNLRDRHIKLGSLDEVLEKDFQIQPSTEHFERWKASFAVNIDQKEIIGDVDETLLNQSENHIADHSIQRVLMSPDLCNVSKANCNQLRPKAIGSKKRDGSLHQLIFKENGLRDGSKLAYRKRGKTVKTGYKLGNGIMCDCCNKEMKPSQFEAHAGFSQTRQPYRNIYTSNGLSLHDVSIALFNGENRTLSIRVCCEICGTGGELLCCDGCTKSFHADCLKLQVAPDDEWYCTRCIDLRFRSGSEAISSGAMRSTKRRSRLMLKAETDQLLCCTFCRDGSFILNDFGAKTIIFCLQCEREYHIGCLKDHEVCNLKEVPMDGKWFCSAACDSIYATLQELVNDGETFVPDWLSSVLKSRTGDLADELKDSIRWQILNGKHAQDYSLLSKTIGVFHEALDPIVEGGKDFITAMVHAEDAAGKMLEGVYCAIITVKSIVISAAIFRVFGENVAELPLVATSEKYRGMGYFRVLYSLLERVLSFFRVKYVVVPATEDVRSLWIDKIGFSEMAEERLQAYLATYPLILFETTSILEKTIPFFNGKRRTRY